VGVVFSCKYYTSNSIRYRIPFLNINSLIYINLNYDVEFLDKILLVNLKQLYYIISTASTRNSNMICSLNEFSEGANGSGEDL